MRKHGRSRRLSLPFICSFLLLLIAVIYLTDFPRRSVFNLSKSAVEFVNNNSAPSIQFINKQLKTSVFRETITRVTSPFSERTREHRTSLGVVPPPSKESVTEKTTLIKVESTNKPKTTLLDREKMLQIEKRFQVRRKRVSEYCQRSTPRQMQKCEADNITQGLKYVKKSNLLYCTIEKTGSTFWKRILHVTSGWSNASSPHAMKSADAQNDTRAGFKNLINVTYSELHNIFDNSKTIMFVRDPLARLFSGWLDKFFSTNPYYWGLYGKRIIQSERYNATNSSRTCGHDVTFPEFVSFVSKYVQLDRCLDSHFNPNFKHCAPCYLSYDYIGKYETLKEDTLFLLQKLNLSDVVKFTNFENDAINDIMIEDAEWVFLKRNETKNCIPFICGLFRVWKRLQSRGIISKHLELPYTTNKEANHITVEEFTRAITDAHTKSNPTEIKQNRREVMIEAFTLLPKKIRTRMLSALSPDFELFDYDRNSSFLRSNTTTEIVRQYTLECPYTFEDP